jgi:outer membrane biogenesis lipoprotein LolB
MRRLFYLTLLVSLLLSACAAGTPTTAPVIKTEFTPTDPTTVNLALGKPQFVEFFAFW